MLKSILCYGEKTRVVLDKLNYSVNGIEIIGCENLANLSALIKKSGALSSILIAESAIDKENYKLPQVLKENPQVSVILLLNDQDLMQKYDIEYYSYSHIYIIDNQHKPVTLPYLKELVSSTKIESYMLYKSSSISTVDDEEEAGTEEIPSPPEEEAPKTIEILEEDSEPLFNLDEGNNSIKLAPKQEISLEQDTTPLVAPLPKFSTKSKKDTLKEAINIYHCATIVCTGTNRAYTSTTAYNLAKYFASLDLTVCLIDLDFNANSLSALSKNISNDLLSKDGLTKALNTGNSLNNATLVETNLHLLANSQLCDSIEFENKEQKEVMAERVRNLVINSQSIYDLIIVDMPFNEIKTYKYLLDGADKIVMNIRLMNKDLLSLMRKIELLNNNELVLKIFNGQATGYIGIDDKKMKLLDSKYADLTAIDNFLKDNGIINEFKYGSIPRLGTINSLKEYTDYYGKKIPYNETEIENIALRIFKVL